MNAGQLAEAIVRLMQENDITPAVGMNAAMRVSAFCAHQLGLQGSGKFGFEAKKVYDDVGKALGKRTTETVH